MSVSHVRSATWTLAAHLTLAVLRSALRHHPFPAAQVPCAGRRRLVQYLGVHTGPDIVGMFILFTAKQSLITGNVADMRPYLPTLSWLVEP